MKTESKTGRGFTLIELMVVIAIIATLATVATPMLQVAQVQARMTRTGADARSIMTALTMYASEHGGLYPEAATNSNEAFAKLFPSLCDSEALFYVQGDRLHCNPTPPDEGGEVLAPGENHWAFVSGLSDSHKSNTPILADAFTDGIGKYDQHHVWSRLNKAIVGRLDGSITMKELTKGEILEPLSGPNLFASPAIDDDDLVQVLNPTKRLRAD